MRPYGFSSKEIPDLIEYSKETGRIQFILEALPIDFEGLHFLEPIFRDLKPPVLLDYRKRLDDRRYEAYDEIVTVLSLDENYFLEFLSTLHNTKSRKENLVNLRILIDTYSDLRSLGFDEIADEIINNILIDFPYSDCIAGLSDSFITGPILDPFNALYTVNYEKFVDFRKMVGKKTSYERISLFPFEIGTFLLKHKSFSPLNFEDCKLAIELYKDNEFFNVYKAFIASFSDKNYYDVEKNKKNLNEIFRKIWDEAEVVKRTSDFVKKPIDFFIGGVGLTLSELVARGVIEPNMGLLAGLGYLGTNVLAGNFLREDIPLWFSKMIEKLLC